MYADLQKMKLLGLESGALDMPNNIQPREYSKGGGTDGFQTIRDRDGNLKLFNCNRNGSESWLNNNNGHEDNKWNSNNRFFFVRKSLISLLFLRESFVLDFALTSLQESCQFHLFFLTK
jgi:hypothetical protein